MYTKLTISHLNVAGCTVSNNTLRSKILEHLNFDIISVNETHLKSSDTLTLERYQFLKHNRQETHRDAPKGSGGVGLFIKSEFLNDLYISVVDNTYDGILGISLIHKQSEYNIIVFTVYLSPENSPWGRNGSEFYAHLHGQIYLLSNADALIICGDLNSRIGDKSDLVNVTDNIRPRNSIDNVVNQRGLTFIDFLCDLTINTIVKPKCKMTKSTLNKSQAERNLTPKYSS